MRKSRRGQKPCLLFFSVRAMTRCFSRRSKGNMCPGRRVHIETENANHIRFLISECNTTISLPRKKKFLYNKNDPTLQICIFFKVSWSLKGSQGKKRGISGSLHCFMSSWQQRCLRTHPLYWKQESHVREACREHIKSKVIYKLALHFSLHPEEVTAVKLCGGSYKTKEDLHHLWHNPVLWIQFTKLPEMTCANLVQ